jgi:hypothetical protein
MEDTTEVRDHDYGRADLDRLLARLDSERTIAWEKYRDLRRRLVKFFEWNQCTFSEELADEVLDRVARKPKDEEIRDVTEYVIGIARYVRLEDGKRSKREFHFEDSPGGTESLAEPGDLEQEIVGELDQQSNIDCLRECLGSLRAPDRTLVLDYYSAEEEKQKVHRQKLANAAGITMIALRVRTNRLREKLEQCVKNCLETRRQNRRMGERPPPKPFP